MNTPGPWKAYLAAAHWNIRANQETVANVFRQIGSPVTMEHDEEGDANARLIAAAPELLEALKVAKKVCGTLLQSGDGIYVNARRMINEAIAKAEVAR